jgi:hypothetical protein
MSGVYLSRCRVEFVEYRCSCSLCGMDPMGWGPCFPAILNNRPDLNEQWAGTHPSLSATYAAPNLPTQSEVRTLMIKAGWKVFTVSRDGGVNTSEVAICPTCQIAAVQSPGDPQASNPGTQGGQSDV